MQTRAEKKDAAKNLIREILQEKSLKASELIDEAAKLYTQRFGGEDTENPNDVKGRVGSLLDVMKKDGDVTFDGGMYALSAPAPVKENEEKPATEEAEKPVKKTARGKAKKAEEEKLETVETQKEETSKPKRTAKKKQEKTPLPPAPLQPIAPVDPVTPAIAPEPIPETESQEKAEKPAPKKRARKPKTEEVKEEQAQVELTEQIAESKAEAKEETAKEAKEEQQAAATAEKNELIVKPKAELSPKGTVMDMSFLFGSVKPTPRVEKPVTAQQNQAEEKKEAQAESKAPGSEEKAKEGGQVRVQPQKPQERKVETRTPARVQVQNKNVRTVKKTLTPDEKLQAAFLAKLHRLGGEYFEYYSVYLLEKYSRRNGRRLESLRITGGEHDGGIDGEIELTDRLGFRETIYIQAKNWDPDKGDEKLWVVGETLLQQFIGACVCRQAKEGKQNCRGIFITTSRFTPEAKRIFEETADKFVGYDGADLYEAAKECEFGIVKKNGEWALDENLLSGEKAFFNML